MNVTPLSPQESGVCHVLGHKVNIFIKKCRHYRDQIKLTIMIALQHYIGNPSAAISSTQMMPIPPEKAIFPGTYNIFKIVASLSIACVCAIFQYFWRKSMPSVNTRNCKPCKKCTNFPRMDSCHNVDLRLVYENKSDDKIDDAECKYNICKISPSNFSNHPAGSTVDGCRCTTCYNNYIQGYLSLPFNQTRDIISDITRLKGPYENSYNITYSSGLEMFRRYHDFHTTLLENHPFNIKKRQVQVYDPIRNEVLLLNGHCEYKNKPQSKQYFVENLRLHKLRCTDSAVCKCSPCECLSCPLNEQAYRAGSEESYKSRIIQKYIKDEWKRRSRTDDLNTQNYRKGCRKLGCSTKDGITKVNDAKCSGNCSRYKTEPDAHARSCRCSNSNMKSINEMLSNVYGSDIDIEQNNKNTLNEQLSQNDGSRTVVNHATSTNIVTVNKSVGTSSFQQSVENTVKNYEYTLKIEIITPKFDSITKHDTKQKIKKVSKNKIKEQTQKVMNDIINDISNNSAMVLTKQLSGTEQKSPKDIGSIGQSWKPSSLKQIVSPVSIEKMKTSPSNRSLSILSSTRSKGSKMKDSTVGYLTPFQQVIIQKKSGNDGEETKLELPSTDGSLLFQNSTNPQSTAQISTITSVNEMELVKYLHELRVRDPCIRRVSYHTVSLKWKSPKVMEDVAGYEILVDGKTIEKIFNKRRCMAVISCLPPARRLLITIRTITKSPSRGLLPCTTIGYRPRANKYIRI